MMGDKKKVMAREAIMRGNIFVIISFLLLFSAVFVLGATAFAESEADPELLKTLLEEDAFRVQKGIYRELDTVKEASAGRLLSCFGNNAGSAYIVFSLPSAPEQDTSLGSEKLGWPDEIATVYDDPTVENAPANPYFAPGGWEYNLHQLHHVYRG